MPFIRALSPTRNASPLARRRWRRRAIQILTGFWLLVSLVGVGFALVQGSVLPVNSALAASLPASGPIVPNSTVIIDYSYDPLYRLTEADYNSVGQVYTYTYDSANNRLAAGLNGTQVTTYTYDIANRLTQVDEQAYAYDNSGNLLSDGVYTYTYDSANRLIQLVDGISTKAYEYNGDGVRVAQIEDGLRTDYVQDVAAPLPQVLTARQGGTVSTYLRGLGLIGEQRAGTGPLAGPATWQYTLPDALGSVRQVVDGQGVVTVGRHYDPFGAVMMEAGTGRSAYGFAGEEQDAETDQLFLRARTYKPSTGRFLQQDDVLGTANQPRTLHRYTYSFNNPINYTDPSGHMPSFLEMACGALKFAFDATVSLVGFFANPGENAKDLIRSIGDFAQNPSDPIAFLDDLAGQPMSGKNFERGLSFFEENLGISEMELRQAFEAGYEGAQMVYQTFGPLIDRAIQVATTAVSLAATIVTEVLIGDFLDVGSLIVGYDVRTGEKLSREEKALMVAGLAVAVLTLGVGDDVVDVARALRHADEVAAVSRHADEIVDATRHADELADAAKISTRHSDELVNVAETGAIHGDDWAEAAETAVVHGNDFDNAVRLEQHLDDSDALVQPQKMNHTTQYNGVVTEPRRMSVSPEQGDELSELSNINRVSEDEIYQAIEDTDFGSYVLKLADREGARPKIVFTDKMSAWAQYDHELNIVEINESLHLDLPAELIAPTVTHELVHRSARWFKNSLAQEQVAHIAEGLVWKEIH